MPQAPDSLGGRPIPPGYAELVIAVEAGRAGRGRPGGGWAQMRALALGYMAQGMVRARIGGLLGRSTPRITQLREEGCEAVLLGGAASAEADAACGALWQRWCLERDDAAACARVARIPDLSTC
jgi:hypothetical protein